MNAVHVRDQKHEQTLPRNRYPCDNGNKKDLKPKRIKDYLEYKKQPKESCFIKTLCRGLNQPRKSAQAGPVVSCRDIPFVNQLKQIIEAPR
ncbi:hypothetical protein GQ457_13G014950 [Hibiscus cannabinus]